MSLHPFSSRNRHSRRVCRPSFESLEKRDLLAALVDDSYEQNDTFLTAHDFGTVTSPTTIPNLVQADSNDWYRFTIAQRSAGTDNVGIRFTHADGDVDLELYNASGRRLRVSNGVSDSESISLSNLAAGAYFVRVFGYRGATNPNYSLTINVQAAPVTPPPPPNSSGFDIQLVYSGMTASQQAIFERAAAKWESIITSDLPNATFNGQTVDDLLINASAVAIDGRGGVLGQAGPDRFRGGTRLPYHGAMQFDTADMAAMEANGTLQGVVMHEMGHVLGIGTLWAAKGLIVGAGTSSSRFIGPQATAAYNALFGTTASGVPLETAGGSGTRDAHWKESVFGNEIMTGFVGPGTSLPVSRVTIASLADLGYTVNLAAADPFSAPAGALASLVAGSSRVAPGLSNLADAILADPTAFADSGDANSPDDTATGFPVPPHDNSCPNGAVGTSGSDILSELAAWARRERLERRLRRDWSQLVDSLFSRT